MLFLCYIFCLLIIVIVILVATAAVEAAACFFWFIYVGFVLDELNIATFTLRAAKFVLQL